eukprot:TRINITY_DN1278_c0_g1_i4.p1 TRINITY_DN1278_c0_g1~~TRINITY_DN1278_c0_g1_i4.p1  ORF type:complete len:157 (+),score=27.44 TRINITY_DN1278_c0_g1_i4:153-623(+)
MNCYQILGVSRESPLEDIKRAYKRLALIYHPDKQDQQVSSENNALHNPRLTYPQIQQAWSTLRDTESRKRYDKLLFQKELTPEVPLPVSSEVDLDDMSFVDNGGSEGGSESYFWYPCRCGDRFIIHESQLDQGLDIVCCSSCSFVIRVLYQKANEE